VTTDARPQASDAHLGEKGEPRGRRGTGGVVELAQQTTRVARRQDAMAHPSITPPEGTSPYLELLTRHRRNLHRIPEVDFDLPRTIDYVTRELEVATRGTARIFSPARSTVCAYFDVGATHTTAVRSDMDALPVHEETGVSFASTIDGHMHACGHDGHMAMVLALASWTAEHVDELPRNILLVFQPAEETTGGANVVCKSGIFAEHHADRIFGFHLWPSLPAGQIASRPGALLAASNETDVRFLGRASHIARAEEGADALLAAARFLGAAYDHVDERSRAAAEPALLKFGRAQAGEVRNQIAAEALLEGSLRTFSIAMRDELQADVGRLAAEAAASCGCTAEVAYSAGYPPVINDTALFALAADALPGLSWVEEPLLISEDFAWYQQWLPGVFLLLGTGTGIPLHASTFDFDESVLTAGLAAYQRLVMMP